MVPVAQSGASTFKEGVLGFLNSCAQAQTEQPLPLQLQLPEYEKRVPLSEVAEKRVPPLAMKSVQGAVGNSRDNSLVFHNQSNNNNNNGKEADDSKENLISSIRSSRAKKSSTKNLVDTVVLPPPAHHRAGAVAPSEQMLLREETSTVSPASKNNQKLENMSLSVDITTEQLKDRSTKGISALLGATESTTLKTGDPKADKRLYVEVEFFDADIFPFGEFFLFKPTKPNRLLREVQR